MITSKIRQRIQELSSEYYARVQIIETKAKQLLEYSQGGSHLSFTPHGLSHISAVERNYDWLLSESDLKSFNSSELFLLICATFFHDALMIPRKLGDEQEAREHHIKRAYNFLVVDKDLLGLSIHEADFIFQIIRAHGVNDLDEIPTNIVLGAEKVDLRKLGACLSLSDICHADSSRAPEIVFKNLELEPDSILHWRKHLQISGITREEDAILMSALIFSDDGLSAIKDYKDAIAEQLSIVRPYFDTVLKPIRRVELTERRLESPLQQTLQFQTNTPAILKLLIEGVYEREDVFIRELVQNSLDSCLLRRAKQQRRILAYEPAILLTIYREKGKFKAFRIDDNGVGMDLNDIQDIVLWIGNSISSKSDIINLLQKTLGKNLIATFGIGLLSSFKASNRITIRTHKENETPLHFELTSVSDSVRPEKSSDVSIGTTIIVELPESKAEEIDPEEAIEYYFRMVRQVNLKVLELEWSTELTSISREGIFKIALTESFPVEQYRYLEDDTNILKLEIIGEDFSGFIWIPNKDVEKLTGLTGSIDILNEGIFVVNEPTREWFPSHLSFCQGVLNFSSKSLSLPAGRDRIIKNDLFRAKIQQIIEKSFGLIEVLVQQTHNADASKRDFAALILAHIYRKADLGSRKRLLKRLDNYSVKMFKRSDRLTLKELVAASHNTVYIQYTKGRFVSDLTMADGKQLYHKEDDFVELQAAIMAQENQIVLSTARVDTDDPLLEANLIKAYCAIEKLNAVDLTLTVVIAGKEISRPVPDSISKELGSSNKFVEISGLPNKRAWRVGKEVWINLANPTMRSVYYALQKDKLERDKVKLASILFSLLAYRLDDTVNKIALWLEE